MLHYYRMIDQQSC